ncbi:hypothetical protein D3C87_38580 [compost metagenome]
MKIKHPGLLFILLFTVKTTVFAQLPLVNGWTQFTPSSDTRIIYVSDSDGNDATANFYNTSDNEVGSDPFQPAGPVLSYRTLAAAFAQVRNGFPDWILLKKGDTFTNQSFGTVNRSGRNANEPVLIGSYGSSAVRPRILTGANTLISFTGSAAYVAVVGLHAEPHTRSGSDEPSGINILNAPFRSFLVEDCYFNLFHMHLVVQDYVSTNSYNHVGFTARRNILTNAYKLGGGGGGVYMHRVDSILFEENLIDHNGWSSTITGAEATGFSHNTYFQSSCDHLIFRDNIVSRASAVGIGARCGGTVSNNLLLSNPRNLFVGSFDPGQINWPAEGVTGEVSNNVILNARSESFDAGNGITIDRVRKVNVHHNIVAHFTSAGSYNIGIGLDHIDSVQLKKNIIYKWGNNQTSGWDLSSGISFGPDRLNTNRIDSNDVQMKNMQGHCVTTGASFAQLQFHANRYYNVVAPSEWFGNGNYANWITTSSETGSQQLEVPYTDPERSIATYLTSVSETGDLEEFIQLRKQQGKGNWNAAFTAQEVNKYIRQGFDMEEEEDDLSLSENPVSPVKIYPNPSTDGKFILLSERNEVYTIYSLNGVLVQTGKVTEGKNEFHISTPGIYLLQTGLTRVKLCVR